MSTNTDHEFNVLPPRLRLGFTPQGEYGIKLSNTTISQLEKATLDQLQTEKTKLLTGDYTVAQADSVNTDIYTSTSYIKFLDDEIERAKKEEAERKEREYQQEQERLRQEHLEEITIRLTIVDEELHAALKHNSEEKLSEFVTQLLKREIKNAQKKETA